MSSELIHFVYVSRATFKPFDAGSESGLDANVVKILNQSRKNNQKRNLVGALYYGSGCFFCFFKAQKQILMLCMRCCSMILVIKTLKF